MKIRKISEDKIRKLDEQYKKSRQLKEAENSGRNIASHRLTEAVDTSILPIEVRPIGVDKVIEVAKTLKKGAKIKIGYIRPMKIKSMYRADGRDHKEDMPVAVAFKMSEYRGATGVPYENSEYFKARENNPQYQASKEANASAEPEVKNPRISEWLIKDVVGLNSRGNTVLAFYSMRNNRPNVKYFLSLDGEMAKEVDKTELEEYVQSSDLAPKSGTDAHGTEVSNNYQTPLAENIYRLNKEGDLFMMPHHTYRKKDKPAEVVAGKTDDGIIDNAENESMRDRKPLLKQARARINAKRINESEVTLDDSKDATKKLLNDLKSASDDNKIYNEKDGKESVYFAKFSENADKLSNILNKNGFKPQGTMGDFTVFAAPSPDDADVKFVVGIDKNGFVQVQAVNDKLDAVPNIDIKSLINIPSTNI